MDASWFLRHSSNCAQLRGIRKAHRRKSSALNAGQPCSLLEGSWLLWDLNRYKHLSFKASVQVVVGGKWQNVQELPTAALAAEAKGLHFAITYSLIKSS